MSSPPPSNETLFTSLPTPPSTTDDPYIPFQMHYRIPPQLRDSFFDTLSCTIQVGLQHVEHGRFLAFGNQFDTIAFFCVPQSWIGFTVARAKRFRGWVQWKFPEQVDVRVALRNLSRIEGELQREEWEQAEGVERWWFEDGEMRDEEE
ncbi:hypothetical protein PHSY_000416 [Pseudozyma hubeiensis SY62]|uniref:Uncharacterized protein n=1 Tax=Pseudozyma hubeiensis (strain SY62) TaxID=1305764 RepID=R9NWG6_PSEHS|nr:hypothetical protein PHSY_000416 [Pseudozyma hubeiensis SY62]GAC92859.1 hypothetical protein PHSY_000416 [Pseudozyma hubeiensis SY62]